VLLLQLWLLPATATSSSDEVSVSRCCQDNGAGLYIQSTELLQSTAVWCVWRADASSTLGPERCRATCNWRIWQTVSLPPTSARTDSDQPIQRQATSDVQITVSATGVLQLLDHVCGTCCQFICRSVTVSNSLNSCWICVSCLGTWCFVTP